MLNKNVTYNEKQRFRVSNQIAASANALLSHCEKLGDVDRLVLSCYIVFWQFCRIFDLDFRKGLSGFEEDLSRESDASLALDFGVQDETDWDVETVEDEDSL